MSLVNKVRSYLNDISPTLLSDSTLRVYIDEAQAYIDYISHESATTEQKEHAVIAYAGYKAFVMYAATLARGPEGEVPPDIRLMIERLERERDKWLALIADQRLPDVVIDVTDSLWDDVE